MLRARDAHDHFHDGTDRDGGRDGDHEIISHHHHAARNAGGRAVAAFQEFRHRIEIQIENSRHQHRAEHEDSQTEHEHEPHAGNAVLVSQLDTAHSGRAPQHDRGQRSGVQPLAHGAPRDQKLILARDLALRPIADA